MKKRVLALFIALIIIFSFATAAYAGPTGGGLIPPEAPIIQTSAPIIINISPPICY